MERGWALARRGRAMRNSGRSMDLDGNAERGSQTNCALARSSTSDLMLYETLLELVAHLSSDLVGRGASPCVAASIVFLRGAGADPDCGTDRAGDGADRRADWGRNRRIV